MSTPKHSFAGQLLVAGVFVVLTLAALYGFVRFAEPDERIPRRPFRQDYDEKPLADLLAEHGFEARMREIAAAGEAPDEKGIGRPSGSPGFYRTERLILDAYRAAGLEIVTQEFPVVVPVTEYCEILDERGLPLEDVRIFPFAPAAFLPIALPAEGVKGTLVDVEQGEGLVGHDPEQAIVFSTMGASATDSLGVDWRSWASHGVKAVLVREEREDIRRVMRTSPDETGRWGDLRAAHPTSYGAEPITFPRFLVRGPIENYAGRTITLRCKVTWQTRHVRNLIGVLRGDRPRDEALVITSYYDSSSGESIPELAPGAEQSISLAAMLEYVRGLAHYRGDMERDIVFVATAGHFQAMAGEHRLVEAIETLSAGRDDYRTFEERRMDEQRKLDFALQALVFLERSAPHDGVATAEEAAAIKARWAEAPEEFRKWLSDRIKTVAGEVCLDRGEDALQAKLDHIRVGAPAFREGFDSLNATDAQRQDPANTHPLLKTYLDAKRLDNRAANMMTLPLWTLAARDEYAAWGYPARLTATIESIASYHRQKIREIDDLIAVRDLFGRYGRTLTITLDLYSGGYRKLSDLAVLVGIGGIGTEVEPQVSDVANAILERAPVSEGKPAFNVVNWGGLDAAGKPGLPNHVKEAMSPVWYACGRLAFTVANREYGPAGGTRIATPEDTLANLRQTDVLRLHIPALGRALLSMAYGRVTFKAVGAKGEVSTLHGAVYANAGFSEMVPSHRMAPRTFVQVVGSSAVLALNPYGEFRADVITRLPSTFSMIAARFSEDGRICYIKDDSVASSEVFKNTGVQAINVRLGASRSPKPINIPVFRCEPITLFEHGNPTTLKAFKGVTFLASQGLSAPPRAHREFSMTFLPPETAFYIGFLDGVPGNEELSDYRAFMLNVDPAEKIGPNEPEIYGAGYLAADAKTLVHPQIDAAASMLRTAEKRLALQREYGMADEQMIEFHERGKEWLDDARAKRAAFDPVGARSSAATSLAYAVNNHPVIRKRIAHAVVGILWYLGLLVPFVFFAEKLIFGYPDIRKQLAAVGAVFLVVFTLLRIFHPAFQMVRSSLMILLGFIMLLLTGLVTLMVGGKFKQNIKALRSREGSVEGADINRGGVVGTAFMLGLNNMRRRKVRTGLTCVTLVLITFVMICFTSVSTDLANVEYLTGRSVWNGITIRDPEFRPLEGAESGTINSLYASRYPVTTHRWMIPAMNVWEGNTEHIRNLDFTVDSELEVAGVKTLKSAHVSSAVAMQWCEPMFSGIDKLLLTDRGWFPRPPSTRAEKLDAVRTGFRSRKEIILPEPVARELGISVADVNTREPTVSIHGDEFLVRGIIDSVEVNKHLGLDGAPMFPFDLNSVQTLGTRRRSDGKFEAVVPAGAARLPAAEVLILNEMPATMPDRGQTVAMSCSVLFPSEPYRLSPTAPERPPVGYREQRRVVMEYLERTGKQAYYALDGVSYFGSRRRTRTLGGMIELLVPIVIAALAVFNTMRGSVYERRSEIYVYNAVGIAPNHVFFMFMAEALVYAVMGAMLGYLLSQATGRVLTLVGMTGGLNMDYSSIETIYASLAIMAAVLLSSVLPARDAARMAAPSELVSWAVPRAEGDVMTLNLPFTFTAHDRVAVVSYFCRWLDANGAGSSGPFFCSQPESYARVEDTQPEGDRLVPVVSAQVWLKPYDLGVSHRMDISLPTDPETGEYIAHIRLMRSSGHAAAWRRTVKPFLGVLRKQFLNWRATTDDERGEMFADARRLLQRPLKIED